jgi:uncharacterized membrane protein
MSYLLWKLLHNAAVVLFLGNIITGLFWAAHGRRSRDLRVVAIIFDGLIRSDRWFTVPSVVTILISGVAAAGRAGLPVLGTGWLLWSSLSFAVAGILFGVRVAPLQRRILDLAVRAEASPEAWALFTTLYWQWELYGALSIVAVLGPFVLMILKTSLPAL